MTADAVTAGCTVQDALCDGSEVLAWVGVPVTAFDVPHSELCDPQRVS
jgi:hypothetical protein